MYKITIANQEAELIRVNLWLAELAKQCQWSEATLFSLDLVLNEVIANCISYGYDGKTKGWIEILISDLEDRIQLQVSDDGIAFDPTEYEQQSPAENLAEASIGGRGLILIKKYAEHIQYQRLADINLLKLTTAKR